MNGEFLEKMQNRIASTAVGPSTARGMRPKGTIKSAREFLRSISLATIAHTKIENQFRVVLVETTEAFIKAMPSGGGHWGSCRKFLNIFLRGATYNHFLRQHYRLENIELWLEVPLDSHVATGLREDAEKIGEDCPTWKTVKGLDPKTSDQFQNVATAIARTLGVARIHLDLRYWRRPITVRRGRKGQKS